MSEKSEDPIKINNRMRQMVDNKIIQSHSWYGMI